LTKKNYQLNFNIGVSTIEDFIGQGLIQEDKVEQFKASYKNPALNMCFLMISVSGGVHIVFIPFGNPAPAEQPS
jgi:hypothetical protein